MRPTGTKPKPSIQIRLRKRESVLNQFDPRIRVVGNDHLYYVEAEKDVRVLKHAQPGERAA